MKKLINILLPLLLLFPHILYSQDLTFSVPDKIKGKIVFSEILGEYKDYYYVVRYDKKAEQAFVFEKYSKDLRLVRNLEFQIANGINVEDIHFMDGLIYFFTSQYNKDEKAIKLYCTIYDEGFVVNDKENLIASSTISPSEGKLFKIEYDKLYKQIAVLYPFEKVKEVVKFRMLLLNSFLETENAAETRISYEREFNIENLELFNGQLAALISFKSSGVFKGNQQQLDFYYYNLKTDVRRIRSLAFDSIKMSNSIFRYDFVNQEYLISGFYTDSEYNDLIGMGVLRYIVNADSLSTHFLPFSKEMVTGISGIYDATGIRNFFPKGLILRDDRGFVMISEYYSVQREVQNDYYAVNNTVVKYYYRFSDIMVVSVNHDGQVDWNKIIRKDQQTMNDEGYYSSFMFASLSDKIVLLFNDFSRSRWNLLYNVINPDGEVDFEVLVNGNNFTGSFVPKNGRQVGLSELLIPAIDSKHGFSLLKIQLK
ncbi:hypothetical protein ACFLRI_02015 [Bacteroidota bacterium]